jgi:transportin-1
MRLAWDGKAQLLPHLNNIAETLVKALQLYQLNNQRILFDAVGAVAWGVGAELEKPPYMQALVQPILTKFESIPDNDVLALPLCECVANLAEVMGKSLAAALPRIIMRGIKTVNDIAMASQMWEQNPNEYERPEREMMASVCDLFSGVLQGLKEHAKDIAAQMSMLTVASLAIRNSSGRAKQSGLWLMSVAAIHCPEVLAPHIPELMPLCAAALGPSMTMTVSINAGRAIGEVCQRMSPEAMAPHLNALVPPLVAILQRADVKQWQMSGHNELLRTVCSTLNCLRQRTALGQQWPQISAQLPALQKLQQRYGLSV